MSTLTRCDSMSLGRSGLSAIAIATLPPSECPISAQSVSERSSKKRWTSSAMSAYVIESACGDDPWLRRSCGQYTHAPACRSARQSLLPCPCRASASSASSRWVSLLDALEAMAHNDALGVLRDVAVRGRRLMHLIVQLDGAPCGRTRRKRALCAAHARRGTRPTQSHPSTQHGCRSGGARAAAQDSFHRALQHTCTTELHTAPTITPVRPRTSSGGSARPRRARRRRGSSAERSSDTASQRVFSGPSCRDRLWKSRACPSQKGMAALLNNVTQ